MTDQLQYQIALTLLPHVGPVTAKTLVSYCGSAEAVFRASRRALLRIPGIGPGLADGMANPEVLRQAEAEVEYLEQHGISAIFYTDARYPVRLRQNVDCPALLYFKGSDPGLLDSTRMVAIIGTRQPTEYGRTQCIELVEGLQAYGVTVVSGLAYGIDITAHRHATLTGIPNIAVLGHGLGSIYPSQHRSTAMKLMEHGGLLSEYPHRMGPDREHFPMRNRIIAGLCDAVVVVETATAGGSMITAELAGQYAREVFAVPGRLRDPKSAGCNLLIRTHRARLLESAADLAEMLNWEEAGTMVGRQAQLFAALEPAESTLVEFLRNCPQAPIDTISQHTRHTPGELAALLLGLEFKGLVRFLPGNRYALA
ncbi:MAG: DNA-protecting protein DprA [Bacteroidetes bacterium]|nr:MAG: DNA-protecting protein DprA [Bacteroidota bacterium]